MDILQHPVYLGLIIGISVLNIALLAACFFTVRKRALYRKKQKRISLPIACEIYETSPAFAAFTVKAQRPTRNGSQGQRMSYFQLIHSLQGKPQLPSEKPSKASELKDNRILVSQIVCPPQDIKVPDVTAKRTSMMQRNAAQSSLATPDHHRPAPSLRRVKSLDTETASLYSCVSAPLEFHEHLFRARPFALVPTSPMSAPVWRNVTPLSAPPKAKLAHDSPIANTMTASPDRALHDDGLSRYPSIKVPSDFPVIDSSDPLSGIQPSASVRVRVSSDPPRVSGGTKPPHLRSHSVTQLRPIAPLNVRRVNRSSSGPVPQLPGSVPVPLHVRAPEIPTRSSKRPGPSSPPTSPQ